MDVINLELFVIFDKLGGRKLSVDGRFQAFLPEENI